MCLSLCLFTTCINLSGKKKNIAANISNTYGEKFAGTEKCINCHRNIVEHFQEGAHFKTSAEADEQTIKGDFNPPGNVFSLNYFEKIWLTDTDSGFYQTAIHHNVPGEMHRFDMVVGSGTHGQSYLYWNNNRLYQLPVSYYTSANSWSTSPGYNDGMVNFYRPVTARCLECHATFAKATNFKNIGSNSFDGNQVIYGVTCESCHGPLGKHVAFHEQNPQEKKAYFVVNPGKLSRQQQLDQCGLCHSGLQKNIKPSFSFTPGDTLSKYFELNYDTGKVENLDVHGNKLALLRSSKCFIQSTGMTCSSCHNTHNNEKGNMALFSSRCMNCHDNTHVKFCQFKPSATMRLQDNCIDCHMPQKPSTALTVRLRGEETVTPAQLRTHKIAVYPEETTKVMSYIHSHIGSN